MAVTLVATVGSASANSFCTRAEAITLADEVFPQSEVSDWKALGAADQDRALVEAQKTLEGFAWRGDRVNATQALSLPRVGLLKPDGATAYEDDEIPAAAKQAQARLAFWLAKTVKAGGATGPADTAGLSSISFGSELAMSFEAGATSVSAQERFVGEVVRPILAGLIYGAGVRTVRG